MCFIMKKSISSKKGEERKEKKISKEFKETSFHHAPAANFTVTSSSVPFIKSGADKNLLAR